MVLTTDAVRGELEALCGAGAGAATASWAPARVVLVDVQAGPSERTMRETCP